MNQFDPHPASSGDTGRQAKMRGRRLPMAAVVLAAAIATVLAYRGMVLFGLEVAGMPALEAYALAGFLEVSLVAVALMARSAAVEGRPYGVLLTLTWILSGTSGLFAALHEVAVMSQSAAYMVVFRFVPPLVAALMWHLALVGERHLVAGHTLDQRRRERRVQRFIEACELWRDARMDNIGGRAAARRVRAAHRRQRAARTRALRMMAVEEFDARMATWVERFEAADRHGARLDDLAVGSVQRGTVRAAGADARDPGRAQVTGPATAPTIAAAHTPQPLQAAAASHQDEVAERDRVILELAREGGSERQIAAQTPWSRSTVNRVLKRHGARAGQRATTFDLAPA